MTLNALQIDLLGRLCHINRINHMTIISMAVKRCKLEKTSSGPCSMSPWRYQRTQKKKKKKKNRHGQLTGISCCPMHAPPSGLGSIALCLHYVNFVRTVGRMERRQSIFGKWKPMLYFMKHACISWKTDLLIRPTAVLIIFEAYSLANGK